MYLISFLVYSNNIQSLTMVNFAQRYPDHSLILLVFGFVFVSCPQMISSFTFKQENTIADEPVVDLLKYLNTKLDAAVARARLPSGQNPLEQLVLIIADGRFHEKVFIFFFQNPTKFCIVFFFFLFHFTKYFL